MLTSTSINKFANGIDDEGGTVTFNAGNSITNATTGLLVNGATSAVSGNTINNLTFSSVTGNYITLSGGALKWQYDRRHRRIVRRSHRRHSHHRTEFRNRRQNHARYRYRGSGFCALKAGQVFVTPASGSIQRGIDVATVTATAPGDTVNIKTGTYAGAVSTAAKAVTLAPGSSPGKVTINGNLTLDGNDTLAMEVNGSTPGTDFDQFVVNGTVTLGGAALTTSGTVTSNPGQSLSLILAAAVTGAFASKAEGSTVNINGVDFTISYAGGNNVTLTQAPATVSIAGTTQGSETGPTNATFTVTQTAVSSTDTVVSFTLGGTASEGSDYTAITHSVTIPAGSTTATITIPVINDAVVEPTETVAVTLTGIAAAIPTSRWTPIRPISRPAGTSLTTTAPRSRWPAH